MATRVRVIADGPKQFIIVAPDVRIPFRGTSKEAISAAHMIGHIMGTAFFDVVVGPTVQEAEPASSASRAVRTHTPRKSPTLWARLHGAKSNR